MRKILFWTAVALLFLIFIYLIKSILLPFIISIMTAYFLDPAADRLEKQGVSRTMATALITVAFFLLVMTTTALLLPAIYDQFIKLIAKIPELYDHYAVQLAPYLQKVVDKLGNGYLDNGEVSQNMSGYLLKLAGGITSTIWQSSVALLNLFSLIFLTPIVTFYILRDWDRIIAKLDSLVPRKNVKLVRQQIKLIDKTLAGYIRGQTNVCLIMAIYYSIGLIFVGLDFALIIGILTGILTFIPYVGFFFGFAVAGIVGFFQYGNDWLSLGIIGMVLLVGQIMEGNFITPKLVGDKVGLHPMWLIFGMLVGGALFGFVGVFLAVPLTAVTGVLVKFFMLQYKQSAFYKT